ncbi:MAG: exodeoxyribonuclease VII large subunit [Chloroflexi bacterium]|nr:exodeoxyribonuclease VII large subunit [Chloroflexota bacterium]
MQVHKVAWINRHIRLLLESEDLLQDVWVEGEISNFTRATSGHLYFTLKDSESSLRCVMWRDQAMRLPVLPQNGTAVVAHGRISVYEVQGIYQLYADLLQPAGAGVLHAAFEALKARLQAEGLFDAVRKRPLPPFPRRIGIVTSSRAAALRDIIRVISRRYPLVEVVLAPAAVQGADAPPQIVAALQSLGNHRPEVDLIILARGGGSLEELWAFNDEAVARAVAASPIPVVTGVGHEVDFTIVDFVADLRAPTPSAAAEMSVPDGLELHRRLMNMEGRLLENMEEALETRRERLNQLKRRLERAAPLAAIAQYRQRLDELSRRVTQPIEHKLLLHRTEVAGYRNHLAALNPRMTLARGYAIVIRQDDGRVIFRLNQVQPGDTIQVQVSDGVFSATVDQ